MLTSVTIHFSSNPDNYSNFFSTKNNVFGQFEARQAKPNIVVLEFLDNFPRKLGIKNFDLNELFIEVDRGLTLDELRP